MAAKYCEEIILSKMFQALKVSGIIGFYTDENINLVTNNHILLKVDEDTIWEIQRKFGIRWNNGMYEIGDKYDKPNEFKKIFSTYKETLMAKKMQTFNDTKLVTDGITIFANKKHYAGLNKRYLDIFGNISSVKALGPLQPFVINEKHIVTPIKTFSLDDELNSYLVPRKRV